jgi:hypothetical protein
MQEEKVRPIGRANTVPTEAEREIPWIWEGILAEGAITLLSAPKKTGKTTLMSLLLDRRRAGGQLLGRTVSPGRTVLCSEENRCLWALRQPPLDFGPELLYHTPLEGCPTRGRWKRFIEDLYTFAFEDDCFELLVIDTAINFLPLFERNQRVLRWALSLLREVTSFPVAVLVLNQKRNLHHTLAALADIVVEMAIPRGAGETRCRTFTSVSRYPGALPTTTAELNAESTDYLLLPDSPPPPPPLLPIVQTLLGESSTPLSRKDLLARWPGDPPRPDTLWRTLTRGVELGLFVQSGGGSKNDPFRYALRTQPNPPASPPESNYPPARQ